MAPNKGNKKNLNVSKGKKGFQPSAPKIEQPKQRTGNSPQVKKVTLKAGNKKPNVSSVTSASDTLNDKIIKEQKRLVKKGTATEKIKKQRETLEVVKDKKRQARNLKLLLEEAKKGNEQQRLVVEKILTQMVGKEGLKVKINWDR